MLLGVRRLGEVSRDRGPHSGCAFFKSSGITRSQTGPIDLLFARLFHSPSLTDLLIFETVLSNSAGKRTKDFP